VLEQVQRGSFLLTFLKVLLNNFFEIK